MSRKIPEGGGLACGSCGDGDVKPFLSFGELPLGNAFPKRGDFATEKRYELELGLCGKCKLVQQTKPPPLAALEADYRNYAYVPFGETLEKHYQGMAAEAVARLSPYSGSFIVDVGSNNGLFLGNIGRMTGCKILGVEPAEKISQMARDAGVPTLTEFFTEDTVRKIVFSLGFADLVVCTQTLQHIPDVNEFVKALAALMKPEGTLMIEGRYFGSTVEKKSYDAVYHEMQWFFTLHSLTQLLERHGLRVVHAQRNDIYGGSLRVYAVKNEGIRYEGVVTAIEDHLKLTYLATYWHFAEAVKEHRKRLRQLILKLKRSNQKIAGYGAPSTSATLLNYCGIDSTMVDYIVDDSPLKQGLYTPGTHIPIVSSDRLTSDPPHYLLLNAWRLKDEILARVKKQRSRGMKVIVPLPEIEVI